MDRSRQSRSFACAIAAALLACGDDRAGSDGGPIARDGGVPVDAGRLPDGGPPLTWVDLAIAGCDQAGGDAPGAPLCVATAPATLDFVAIAPARIELYAWSFGDGSPVDERAAPRHRFLEPGRYDVALDVQGPGGTVGVVRSGAIEVVAAPDGATCEADVGCAGGRCVCGEAACGVESGVCAAGCAGCGEGAVCVDLAAGDPAEPAPWQTELCLPSCDEAPCPTGLTCRSLPADGGGFTRACFLAGVGGDLGDSCVAPDGTPAPGACATGTCLPIGLRGLCTATCAAGQCPGGAACATFGGGGPAVCLPRCADLACAADPWLACELAGGPGAGGFVVDEPPSVEGYCAPRRCTDADDCGVGDCSGGFCGP